MLNSLMMISINGPRPFSNDADNVIKAAVQRYWEHCRETEHIRQTVQFTYFKVQYNYIRNSQSSLCTLKYSTITLETICLFTKFSKMSYSCHWSF